MFLPFLLVFPAGIRKDRPLEQAERVEMESHMAEDVNRVPEQAKDDLLTVFGLATRKRQDKRDSSLRRQTGLQEQTWTKRRRPALVIVRVGWGGLRWRFAGAAFQLFPGGRTEDGIGDLGELTSETGFSKTGIEPGWDDYRHSSSGSTATLTKSRS